MAGKKGKSRGRKTKSGRPASPAASTQAAARGFKPSQLEGPFPDHNGDPPGSKASLDGASGVAADRFANGSHLPSTVSSSRPGSQISRVTGGDNPSPAQHQAGTALVATGGDFRHVNGSGGREEDWRKRPPGNRDTGGDRDRPARDHCHNGESLSGSPYLRQSATRQWSWLGYSAKQFRSFAQECPPAMDLGADQVRAKIDDVKCRACRDSLHNALGKGLARGGLPLTKLVNLAACRSKENPKLGEGPTTGTPLGAESPNGRAASSSLPDGRGDIESHTKCGAGAVDRLRIRAPVTPDLLRQIRGVVQASAGAAAAAVAPSPVGGVDVKSPGPGAAGRRLRDLSAEEWLSTYPAPSVARLEGDACNGLKGTGTGSLAITRAQPSVSVSGDERNPWALMERAERAKDSAFKCCGVIEFMTGVGVQDPTAASNGGVSTGGLAGVGTVSGVSSGSVAGGGSAIAANMDWNPQFAPRLQEAETALVDWLTELTMALHGLTFQFTLAFVRDEGVTERGGHCGGKSGGGRDDIAESIALAEVLWTAYEESIKRQLDLTLEARREHLREQSQPMGFALCFAAQDRACAAELLERKRAEMTALHKATIGVMRAGKVQSLLVRAERARKRWSGLLVDEELHGLDDLVERALNARLQIFKCEPPAYNASNDVIQAEQMADAQLKSVVQEWENRMDNFKAVVENRFSEELNPTVYPQSPALTAALQSWLSSFKTDWEENKTTQQLHAHIRQRHVQGLCQTLVAQKHQLKTSNEEAAELGKQRRKRDGKAGVSNSNGNGSTNGVYSGSSEQSEGLVKQRELEERCQSLLTAISLTQQEQIETCFTYRLFAVGQLHQRYRRLRLFFAQLVCRVAARAHLTRHLCGVDSDADERVNMLGACLMLGAVEEACLRWTAVQNERQLVEGMDREDASLDAKRRKRGRARAKVRKNKNASAAALTISSTAAAATAAATTAAAETVAAKGSTPSEDRRKGKRTPTSESARDRASRMPAAGEKSIDGSIGEAIARQGIATAHYVAPQPASPPEKGRTKWAGCGRGSSVAPEEELPEAAFAPLEPTEEASASGVVNNAGEFRGGQEVLGAGKKLLMGVGGAAAPASTELGPEREIARVTRGGLENKDRRLSLEAAKVATSDSAEMMQWKPARREDECAPAIAETMARDGEDVEGEEEEAYTFQFGTANLPDNGVVDNAGLSGGGQEAQGSPESRRYDGCIVENEDDPRKETEETGEEIASEPRPHCEVSPGSLVDLEMQFDERIDSAEGCQDLGGGADEAGDGSSLSQPLQTQQLRGGVFFPANSPPSPLPSLQPQHQQHQQDQEGYTAPHAYHYNHPLQHEGHIPLHHQQHQHEVLTQQHGALQQRGFSHDDGMYGVSHFHQHHPQEHQRQQSHLPYQRGVGVSGLPLHGSAASGGGMHAPGVGVQGLSQHRRGPSHPKGSLYGSSVGASRGSSQHSPHGGQILPPLDIQYGVGHHPFSVMQQQGSTPRGYWAGEMAHYHVPGQHMMAPAPGGIGVTNGQAVYYPPPLHTSGGGHMTMVVVPSINILMDMAGGIPTQMPWMADGGQQHYVHHLTPQQQDWGSPTPGMTYVPPPAPAPSLQLQQQQQQQSPLHAATHQNQEHHWQESENLANGVGDVVVSVNDDSAGERTPTSLNVHGQGYGGGQTSGGHETESMSSPLDGIEVCTSVELDAVATGAQEGLCEARTSEGEVASPSQPFETLTAAAELANGAVSLFSSSAVDSLVTAGTASAERSGAPLAGVEEVWVTGVPEPSEEQCGGGLADPGRPEGILANDAGGEDADEPFHLRPTDGLQEPEAPRTENDDREEGGMRSAAVPEEGEVSAAVAAGTPSSRKGKEKGQKVAQQQQQVRSPAGGKGKRRRGRGGSRSKAGAMAGAASTAKNGSPSPSGPMPRGLVNASGQNNCFLNVVVQSLWHLDAFRAKIGGNSNGSTALGAWGKKPRAWGAAVAPTSNYNASEECSQRVESALRALFRELSGGESGDGGRGEGAGITSTTGASVEALRVAMAKVPGERFALGKMDDAAEALETILGCLVQGASAPAIRQVFSMRIREVLTCPKCGIFSPEVLTTYETNVFYAHMSALQGAREKYPVCSFDVALREASLGDLVTCSNAECPLAQRRERLPSRRSITGEPPSVFSLGLVWNNWGPGLVADLLQMLSPVVDLDVVFPKPFSKRRGGGISGMAWPVEEDISVGKAHLRGFYCFQVQKHHYVAFVYNRGRGEWLLLDDDKAIPIGPEFSGVLVRCKKDKLHPSLLFYERQHPLA